MWLKYLEHLGQELEEKSEKTKYVQRDLEDQIEEEYKKRGKEYQRTQTRNNMSTNSVKKIVIQDVLELLEKGYTRYAKDDKGYGSIQAHYSMNASQVQKLFASQPKLKQRKTITPKFEVVDLESEDQVERPRFQRVEVEALSEQLTEAIARMEPLPEPDPEAEPAKIESRDQLFS